MAWTRKCAGCGEAFETENAAQFYCGKKCVRMREHRWRPVKSGSKPPQGVPLHRLRDEHLVQVYLAARPCSDERFAAEDELIRRVRSDGAVTGAGHVYTWNHAESCLRERMYDRNAERTPGRREKTAYRVPELAAAFRVGTGVIDFVEEEPCESA